MGFFKNPEKILASAHYFDIAAVWRPDSSYQRLSGCAIYLYTFLKQVAVCQM